MCGRREAIDEQISGRVSAMARAKEIQLCTAGAGLLRLPQVLALIPVCRTVWYEGIQRGVHPRPQKLGLGQRISAWKSEDIERLVDGQRMVDGKWEVA